MTFVSQDTSVQDHAQQILKRKYMTPRKRIDVRQPCGTLLPQSTSKGDGCDNLPWLDSKNFSWLSPMSNVSTVSSLASSDVFWNPPETPSGPSGKASSRSILTPLTPPTPPGSFEELHTTPISKLSFGVAIGSVAKQPAFETKDVILPDDPFFQPKIFRHLTLELEAITEKNLAAACVNYDVVPSFQFDASDAVSSRTRSKTSSKAPVTSAVHAVVNERKTNLKASQHPEEKASHVKLRTLLEHIIPLSLHARLADQPGKCPGSLVKDPSDRCKYKAKAEGLHGNIEGLVKKLAKYRSREDYDGMLRYIEKLVQSVMCKTHEKTATKQPENKKRPKAVSKLMELGEMFTDIANIDEDDDYILMQWLDAISDSHASIDHITWIYTSTTIPKPVRPYQPEAPAPVAKTQASSSSSFIPWQSEKSKKMSVFKAVYEKAIAPLGVIAQKPGFVYLFWDREYFGMVKIGYTNDLTKRLESWNKQCNREHVYHSRTDCQVKIPHAHRVEQLVHAELKEYRRRRQCEGCGGMHKEWFDAPQAHVVKVLSKWRDWILQEPYKQDKRSGTWVLKPEMHDSLERMCEPLPREVSVQIPSKRSGGLQRTKKERKGARRTM
ncbi:hypothetical protein G6011_06737 [Alternaria panax]|uniref:Bacteriophage T5 Orf172 DNA-binding domain-containing protein n=1 Tax=Alternaria panax TaxID=48097 RepID=A0AAD4I9V7_9PLEO|nr:hypothetical protein G6011_06737 [Alternaria panax]